MAEQAAPRRAGITLGTAGHIDHGKTRLVAALTGTDTDRLAEERRRGISIELGFARLELPDGMVLGVVDVPGHERLVRTMVAGAGGIDLFLLVVAADDGVMPQTVEHLDVLAALGVERGVVALNKIDLVDAETTALARAEISSLLPGVAVVEVSAERGDGIERLRSAIAGEAVAAAARRAPPAWPPAGGLLHVDRSFTIRGAGTVATGTVAGDGFEVGDRVDALPWGRTARLRGIEIHGEPAVSAGPGRRAALNLAGIGPAEVPRGSVIAAPGSAPVPSFRLDVELIGAAEAIAAGRVQVHHGTRAVAARVVGLGARTAQLRLEKPLVPRARDRLVIRSIAPPATLGGAAVVDPAPRRHGPGNALLRALREGGPADVVEQAVGAGRAIPADPRDWTADAPIAWALPRFAEQRWREAVDMLLASGRVRATAGRLLPPADAPEPTEVGPRELDLIDARLFALVESDGVSPRAPQALAEELGIGRGDAIGRLANLADAGHLERVGAETWYPPDRLRELERTLLERARRDGSITLAGARDALGTSRKYAQALVEHLDRRGLTIRRGDEHVPRSSGARAGP